MRRPGAGRRRRRPQTEPVRHPVSRPVRSSATPSGQAARTSHHGRARMSNLFTQLQADWAALAVDPSATDRLTAWRADDPALAPYVTWAAVQAAAHDRTDPARADRILAALACRA